MGPEKKRFRWLPDTCTGSGQFIQDLNNFCDRWCDRWIMSNKDITFSHEKEINDNYNNGNSLTFDNEEIEKISSLSFEVVLELIAGYTKIIRIDLEELNENVIPEEEINPVVELAFSYGTAMDNWLEDNNIVFKRKGDQLYNICNRKEAFLKFADAVEILKWYCFYIEAKVFGSFFKFHGKLQKGGNESDVIPGNLGSAKASIIAINYSVDALLILYPEMNAQEDEILSFLSRLSVLKKKMLIIFPDAMQFNCPCFDD